MLQLEHLLKAKNYMHFDVIILPSSMRRAGLGYVIKIRALVLRPSVRVSKHFTN